MKKFFILIFVFIFVTFNVFSQGFPVFLDGFYSDWAQTTNTQFDDLNDGQTVDFKSFSTSNDNNYLYFKLDFVTEQDLTAGNQITLFIDTDNNPNTGAKFNGIGAELQWNFGQGYGTIFGQNSNQQISFSDIKLRLLPTVTSASFEIAIGRNVLAAGSNLLFDHDTITICFADNITNGDLLPNSGQTFTYIFDKSDLPEKMPTTLSKLQPKSVRFMTYNIKADFNTNIGVFEDKNRLPNITRIFKAISPEIVTINEAWDSYLPDAQIFMDTNLPLTNGKKWYGSKADGANIILSKYPILQTWSVYSGNSLTACLIDLSELNLENILVIAAHLKCCDDDPRRQQQADAFAAFIIDCKTPGGKIDLPKNTPFILMGDLNLVGLAQQLKTLQTGDIQNIGTFGQPALLDWDDTDLQDLVSYQTENKMAYTWRNDYGSFPPGRLDYMIYSDFVMQVSKTFILQTEIMPSATLNLYGLRELDTQNTSDHFPKIADFILPLKMKDTVPKLKLIEPVGETFFSAGDTLKISWSSYLIDTVSIEFLAVERNEKTVIEKIANQNIYETNWKIPQTLNIADRFQVIISNKNTNLSDTSKVFYLKAKSAAFTLFPNPTKGFVSLDFKREIKNAKLEVYTIDGKLLQTHIFSSSFRETIDISREKNGFYFIKLTTGRKVRFFKVIVQK